MISSKSSFPTAQIHKEQNSYIDILQLPLPCSYIEKVMDMKSMLHASLSANLPNCSLTDGVKGIGCHMILYDYISNKMSRLAGDQSCRSFPFRFDMEIFMYGEWLLHIDLNKQQMEEL